MILNENTGAIYAIRSSYKMEFWFEKLVNWITFNSKRCWKNQNEQNIEKKQERQELTPSPILARLLRMFLKKIWN